MTENLINFKNPIYKDHKIGFNTKIIDITDILKTKTKNNKKTTVITQTSMGVSTTQETDVMSRATSEFDEQIQSYARLHTSLHTHIQTFV